MGSNPILGSDSSEFPVDLIVTSFNVCLSLSHFACLDIVSDFLASPLHHKTVNPLLHNNVEDLNQLFLFCCGRVVVEKSMLVCYANEN